MSTYNVHAGHNSNVPGASNLLDEVTENRKVRSKLISLLKSAGATVYDCTDDSGTTQSRNLANIVAKCNQHSADLDISIHLNAGGGTGVEVYYYEGNSDGKTYATKLSAAIAEYLGIRDRGAKSSTSLYVLRKTTNTAVLIECCFTDSETDYNLWNADYCAEAISETLTGARSTTETTTTATSATTTTSSKPSYTVGEVYTVVASDLIVRTGAGTNYSAVGYSGLTSDAQTKDTDKDGALNKGATVTCKGVVNNGDDIWMRIPSGYIAAYYNGNVYVE